MSITYIDERELKRAYQAGIFDGEGHCFREANHLKVGIAQANYPFLEGFKDEFTGSIDPVNGVSWQWNLFGAPKQLVFLKGVLPYLILKTREVAIAIELCKIIPARGVVLSDKNKALRERLFNMLDEAAKLRKFGYREKPNEAVA